MRSSQADTGALKVHSSDAAKHTVEQKPCTGLPQQPRAGRHTCPPGQRRKLRPGGGVAWPAADRSGPPIWSRGPHSVSHHTNACKSQAVQTPDQYHKDPKGYFPLLLDDPLLTEVTRQGTQTTLRVDTSSGTQWSHLSAEGCPNGSEEELKVRPAWPLRVHTVLSSITPSL